MSGNMSISAVDDAETVLQEAIGLARGTGAEIVDIDLSTAGVKRARFNSTGLELLNGSTIYSQQNILDSILVETNAGTAETIRIAAVQSTSDEGIKLDVQQGGVVVETNPTKRARFVGGPIGLPTSIGPPTDTSDGNMYYDTLDSRAVVRSGSAWEPVALDAVPYASRYQSVAQSVLPLVDLPVLFDDEFGTNRSMGINYTNGTGLFTIVNAGMYQVSYTVCCDDGGGYVAHAFINVDSVTNTRLAVVRQDMTSSSVAAMLTGSALVYCTAGTILSVCFQHDSVGPINLNGPLRESHISIHRVTSLGP